MVNKDGEPLNLKRTDGFCETKKSFIELKNKPTTLNASARVDISDLIKKLKKIYPDHNYIIGFVNDPKNREEIQNIEGTEVLVLGGVILDLIMFVVPNIRKKFANLL